MKTLTIAFFAGSLYAQVPLVYTTMPAPCGTTGSVAYHQTGTGSSAKVLLDVCQGDGTWKEIATADQAVSLPATGTGVPYISVSGGAPDTFATATTLNTIYGFTPQNSAAANSNNDALGAAAVVATAQAAILIDPVVSYRAAGVITTTTGGISSGSPTLTVASASGWSVGMGITVAGATFGGSPSTTVTAISGTTFTLAANASATVSSATVYHDDTAAFNAAITAGIASGTPVHPRSGNYNVTGTLTMASPAIFSGNGPGQTIIWNRSSTADIFAVTYQTALPGSTVTKAGLISDLQINQASDVTPTAGCAFNIHSASGAGYYVTGFHLQRVHMNNLWNGVCTGTGVISSWFQDLYMNSFVGGSGIYLNTPTPAGDLHFDNDELSGYNTGVTIPNSDANEFTNLKTNYSGVSIGSGAFGIRFFNPSIEGPHTSTGCGVTLAAGAGIHPETAVHEPNQIIGGGIGLWANSFCGTLSPGLTVSGTTLYSDSNTAPFSSYLNTQPACVSSNIGQPWLPTHISGTADAGFQVCAQDATNTPQWATLALTFPAAPGPVQKWLLNEGASPLLDSSGHANNIVASNVTYTTVSGVPGTTLTLNGSTSNVAATNNTYTNFDGSTPFSISMWVKAPTSTTHPILIRNLNDTSDAAGFQVTYSSSSQLEFFLISNVSSGNYINSESTNPLTENNLNHIVITYDGTKTRAGVTMYINGSSVAMSGGVDALTGSSANSNPVALGQQVSGAGKTAMSLADVRIWSRAIAGSEVSALYTAGAQ